MNPLAPLPPFHERLVTVNDLDPRLLEVALSPLLHVGGEIVRVDLQYGHPRNS